MIGFTGTPSLNDLIDLFGEYKVLDLEERLGSFIEWYRNAYFRADINVHIVYSYNLLPGAEDSVYKKYLILQFL